MWRAKAFCIFVLMKSYTYKYTWLRPFLFQTITIFFCLLHTTYAQTIIKNEQKNLAFTLCEPGDTFACIISHSPIGKYLSMESTSTRKKTGYLYFLNDSIYYQLDYSNLQYKKIPFQKTNPNGANKTTPTGRKKSLKLSNKTDTLVFHHWQTDSLPTGILDVLKLRYSKWPSDIIPNQIIAETIVWSNRKISLKNLRFSLSPFNRVLFSLPGDFEERPAVYRVSP